MGKEKLSQCGLYLLRKSDVNPNSYKRAKKENNDKSHTVMVANQTNNGNRGSGPIDTIIYPFGRS